MEGSLDSNLTYKAGQTNVMVVHLRMRVSDFIRDGIKDWDVEILENYVAQKDILLIWRLGIRKSSHRNNCWSFKKSGLYTVKS